MRRLLLILLALAPAASAAGDLVPEPSEAAKIEALRTAYILNGFSKVRDIGEGSVDLTQMSTSYKIPGVIRTIPITPSKAEKQSTMPEAVEAKPEKKIQVADICARHGKRRIVRGSSWRCSK